MRRKRTRRPLAPLIALVALVAALSVLIGFRCRDDTPAPAPEATQTGNLEIADAVTPLLPETTAPVVSSQVTSQEADADAEAVEILTKLVYGEAGICSTTEQAAVVWCVLNRVDAGGGDIIAVATAPNQFYGYRPSNPVPPDIEALVRDVLARWRAEDSCIGSVGRVLPPEYMWFSGDGTHNYFRSAYRGGTQWDWSLPSPYEEG